ncbi:membrane-bound PQQ-dependent dehydrogenase, glucose/quinate/shikimate family [Hydrogenophaga sp. BPS33]|uniref:membrane-bound PQQ-dependent dehydrogenase, glucose/quinate/shikimate family n=1 Tax=Hydrogenophaga sp. BPS33 TaxID=2651974 RepID=UPI00131F4EB5|nr:membrane-bound PQQ-dependent dehydrogenase, glucose/quinate/shikimate family [Hydrogenophaga sp. BPS33]QHE86068.1 membrane-bound PQQ-dependent dehydrogenase, glucose/quinate/shikimate family [Hydrogenophaga sp. BPS33]
MANHKLNTPLTRAPEGGGRWPLILFGVVLLLIGLVLAVGGVRLATLGGSWYYLITGVTLVVSGLLYATRRMAGFWLFAAAFFGTVVWSLAEVGLDFWPLVPRLAPMLVLALLAFLVLPRLSFGRTRAPAWGGALVMAVLLIAGGAAMFVPHGVIEGSASASAGAAPTASGESRWQYYGRTPSGTRYAPFAQINTSNVNQLEEAWTFRTGDIAGPGSENQNTPTQIGDTLYVCTPHSQVIALDADTGEQKWKFDPKADAKIWNRCRGVAYYEPSTVTARIGDVPASPPAQACAQRIVLTTVDARMIQLDAKTGEPCAGFGNGGTVDLKQGMGEVKPLYYFQTSMPTVVRNVVVVGGWVFDGREIDEPSGVVRAFSADTGELVWAWDLGNPNITKLPPPGESYTRSTPNVWSTPAFDDELGLIYLPTGNNPPDFWGAQRSKASEAYSSSIVAVDVTTGKERWKFQTVHHDIWDYDVPAQPALYDVPDGQGGKVPALIQITKRGQIFMLDRRDGKPIAEVKELPVPQGGQEGDWTSKTQPYSVGMPAIGTEPLSEARMWGATWFDQLACRIAFKQLRYEGEFTPPTTTPSLIYPGYYGGMNWGSASIDEHNGILVVNDIRMPQLVRLVPRADVDDKKITLSHGVGMHPQAGTPYAITQQAFNSPLGIPCHAPAWGTVTGIDLKTRQIVWQRPAGTVEDAVVSGVKAGVPVPLGMPTLGGPITTAGGLTFYGGTQDYYLRAYDTLSGKELWKGRMPVGGQATPMSYVSPKSGQQYVVMSAGGSRQSPDRGDYVIAYRLKR